MKKEDLKQYYLLREKIQQYVDQVQFRLEDAVLSVKSNWNMKTFYADFSDPYKIMISCILDNGESGNLNKQKMYSFHIEQAEEIIQDVYIFMKEQNN